jgi:hypothetical protein
LLLRIWFFFFIKFPRYIVNTHKSSTEQTVGGSPPDCAQTFAVIKSRRRRRRHIVSVGFCLSETNSPRGLSYQC